LEEKMHRSILSLLTTSALSLDRTIVLVRHGAVDRSAANVPPGAMYGGDIDVPLSLKGKAEARAAASYVTAQWSEIQSVWTSPLSRALYGAQLVADAVGVERVETREAFREIARGGWLRKTPEEIEEMTPGGMNAFLADIEFRPPDGAESIKDVRDRALTALTQEILPSLDEGKVAVLVSHLYVTRALLSFALPGVPIPKIDVPTASIASLSFPGDGTPPIVTSRGFKPDLHPDDKAALAAAGLLDGDAET